MAALNNMKALSILIAAPSLSNGSAAVIFEALPDPPPIIGFGIREIDIDENGTVDFQLAATPSTNVAIRTERSNRYLGLGTRPFPLQDNTVIGPNDAPSGLTYVSSDATDNFVAPDESGRFDSLFLCVSTGCSGFFLGEEGVDESLRGLLGFEFETDAGTNYGFFDIEINTFSRSGVLHGWAFESEPDTAIVTSFIPEPSISGLLVLSMLSVFRRNRHA